MDSLIPAIQSASIMIALLSMYIVVKSLQPYDYNDSRRKWLRNGFLVFLGIVALTFHHHISEHVFIDQRGTAIAIATLFGGVWVGLTTALIETAYRIWMGGAAVQADVVGIASDFLLSWLVLRYMRNSGKETPVRPAAIVWAGLGVGASEALALLLVTPPAMGKELFVHHGIALFLTQFMSTGIIGGLLYLQESRMRVLLLSEQSNLRLQRILHQTVGALSAAMVHRDPTTAGHERRVADLALAVGRKLGWTEERLEGLYLAAMSHDIGQIQVPSEILTRPRKLIEPEFELVKMHAEAGYQILKEIEFPRPIAEYVYQHHENLDGSGYPRGLTGEQILPEARIIRVCDALEAMISHRPFRRAGNIDEALSKLRAQSGQQLDAQIVDICVKLFMEEGYAFPPVKKAYQS